MALKFTIRSYTGMQQPAVEPTGRLRGDLNDGWYRVNQISDMNSSIKQGTHYKLVVSKFITSNLDYTEAVEIHTNIPLCNSTKNRIEPNTEFCIGFSDIEDTIFTCPTDQFIMNGDNYIVCKYSNENVDETRGVEIFDIKQFLNTELNIQLRTIAGDLVNFQETTTKDGFILEFYLIPLPNIY